MLRGVDLLELFEKIGSEQMFHIIDTIVADTAVEDAQGEGNLSDIRAKINKIHGKMGGSDFRDSTQRDTSDPKMIEPVYLEATEAGFPGLEAPLG